MEDSISIYCGLLICILILICIWIYIIRDKGYITMISTLIAVVIITLSLITVYPQYTIEYKNGYNDYPDDTLYIQAKIVAINSYTINPTIWYCDGWEDARHDDIQNKLTMTYEEIQHNISRKAVL